MRYDCIRQSLEIIFHSSTVQLKNRSNYAFALLIDYQHKSTDLHPYAPPSLAIDKYICYHSQPLYIHHQSL